MIFSNLEARLRYFEPLLTVRIWEMLPLYDELTNQ